MILFYSYIKEKLNMLSIGRKLAAIITFAVLTPFLILTIFFSVDIYDATLTKTIQEKQTEISEIEPQISGTVSDIIRQSNQIRNRSFFRRILLDSGKELTTKQLIKHLRSEECQEYRKELGDMIAGSDLKNIRFYLDLPTDSHIFSADPAEEWLLPMQKILGSYWHGIFMGSSCQDLFCPSFYLTEWEKNSLGDLAYMTPFTVRIDGRPVQCYLALYYSSDIINDILSGVSKEDGTVSYLINERDAIITSTDEDLSGIYHFSYDDIYDYLFSSNNYMEKKVLDQTVYLSFKNIKTSNWFLVNVVPDRLIRKETENTIFRYFIIVAIILAVFLMLATKFSSSLAGRISSVISTMGRIREGSLVPMEEPEVKDEIGELISTYNYMTAKQKSLTDDLRQTADELRVAEVNALQAQINPHFLYNTLDTIQWMAMTGKEDQVSSIVQKLSRFYRLTLGRDMTSTTIGKEIEHASIYVDLQNKRFDDAIDLIVDISDELRLHPIPRLTLQPIIENAILHGIREKESQQGSIVVTGWEEEDGIYLLISDDGVGIEEAFLPKILSEEGISSSGKGSNIAIYNVHHRLQLLYGPDYGLSYKSHPGSGTEVTIHLPR